MHTLKRHQSLRSIYVLDAFIGMSLISPLLAHHKVGGIVSLA